MSPRYALPLYYVLCHVLKDSLEADRFDKKTAVTSWELGAGKKSHLAIDDFMEFFRCHFESRYEDWFTRQS
jgi:hypothetical protein